MKITTKLTTLAICSILALNITNKAEAFTNDDPVSDPVLKIGLLYSSDVTPSSNLDNYDGVGYAFGYFDDNRNFVEIYDIDVEEITTMKDDNIYLGTDNLYYDTKLSSYKGVVGAYSLELSSNYTRETAKTMASSIQNGYVAYIDGSYKVRVGSYTTASEATEYIANLESALGDTGIKVVEPTTDTYTVTETKTTDILFEYSNDTYFGIMPKGEITWTKGYRYYGGFEYARRSGGDLTVLNVVKMQDYLKGVLPYEMSASWNVEALKAQALCARSYAFQNINKHSAYGFDLCTSTDCQVYRGTSQASDNSDSAVDQTIGEYIDYNGTIATGFFHSSDGGATENSENVWYSALPYLRGVIDIYENTDEISNGVWETTTNNDDIAWILNAKGYSINGVSDMYISAYTDMGNVYTLTIVDLDGKKYNFSKETARTILNSTTKGVTVNSIRYRINEVMPGVSGSTSNTGSSTFYLNEVEFDVDYGFYIQGSGASEYVDSVSGMHVLTSNGTTQLGENQIVEQTTTTETVYIETEPGTYVISGRGWGHNIGMSQYGALAMAKQGFGYREIIQFYFTGTTVTSKN